MHRLQVQILAATVSSIFTLYGLVNIAPIAASNGDYNFTRHWSSNAQYPTDVAMGRNKYGYPVPSPVMIAKGNGTGNC